MTKVILGGYAGKILRINLSNGDISSEVLDERLARRYLADKVAYELEEPP